MSTWGSRGSYYAVTLTVCLWAVIAGVSTLLRPYIPEEENSPILKKYTSRMEWRPDLDTAMKQAKAQNKPVFLVLYDPAAPVDSRFIRSLEVSREVVKRANFDFVPIKIDVSQEPERRAQFVPLFRAGINAETSLQIVSLSPTGAMLEQVIPERFDRRWREPELLDLLSNLRAGFRSKARSAIEQIHRDDLHRLNQAGISEFVDLQRISRTVIQRPVTSGLEIQLLVEAGAVPVAKSAVEKVVELGGIDWESGRVLAQGGTMASTEATADMALALDSLSQASGDEAYRNLAKYLIHRTLLHPTSAAWGHRNLPANDCAFGAKGTLWDRLDSETSPTAQRLFNFKTDRSYRPKDWRALVQVGADLDRFWVRLSPQKGCDDLVFRPIEAETWWYVAAKVLKTTPRLGAKISQEVLAKLTEFRDAPPIGQRARALKLLAMISAWESTGDKVWLERAKAIDILNDLENSDLVDRGASSTAALQVEGLWRLGCTDQTSVSTLLRKRAIERVERWSPITNSLPAGSAGLAMISSRVQSGRVTAIASSQLGLPVERPGITVTRFAGKMGAATQLELQKDTWSPAEGP